jgi:hypothetical protein
MRRNERNFSQAKIKKRKRNLRNEKKNLKKVFSIAV